MQSQAHSRIRKFGARITKPHPIRIEIHERSTETNAIRIEIHERITKTDTMRSEIYQRSAKPDAMRSAIHAANWAVLRFYKKEGEALPLFGRRCASVTPRLRGKEGGWDHQLYHPYPPFLLSKSRI
jgi:hypothetical protein